MSSILYELHDVKKEYGLDYVTQENGYLLFGYLDINHQYNSICMKGKFYTNIFIPFNFPDALPVVYDTKNEVSDFHRQDDDKLCLGCYGEIIYKINFEFNKNISISQFIEIFVIPFYYSYLYYQKIGDTPYGERGHGSEGVFEYYGEHLNLKDNNQIKKILNYLVNTKYKGHHLCPCCSGKIARKCHGRKMYLLLQNIGKNFLVDDYNSILLGIKLQKQLHYKRYMDYKRMDFYLFGEEKILEKTIRECSYVKLITKT